MSQGRTHASAVGDDMWFGLALYSLCPDWRIIRKTESLKKSWTLSFPADRVFLHRKRQNGFKRPVSKHQSGAPLDEYSCFERSLEKSKGRIAVVEEEPLVSRRVFNLQFQSLKLFDRSTNFRAGLCDLEIGFSYDLVGIIDFSCRKNLRNLPRTSLQNWIRDQLGRMFTQVQQRRRKWELDVLY